jgi:quercetin dioxygenase-like cupin family protein
MAYYISRAAEREFVDVKSVPGLSQALMVGRDQGARNLEASLYKLDPGASTGWSRSPFEESWYVLEGAGEAAIAGLRYEIGSADFGVTPVGFSRALTAGEAGLTWLSVRTPVPAEPHVNRSHYPAQAIEGEFLGRPSETDPRHRFVGHFEDSDMAPYAQISMPGYHGPCIKNISIRMMVDQLIGAQHHSLFHAEIAPRSGPGQAAKVHYHPFEEFYFFTSGGMRGFLDGNEELVSAGDLVWAGTGATHGFINEGDEPAHWIEAQSPIPPLSDAFYFPDDWSSLSEGH